MKPCIGGKGPGSCVGGSKKAGERRSTKVGPPENKVGHSHDYRVVRVATDVIVEGKGRKQKTWSVQTKESHCRNRKGTCDRPIHIDVTRVRLE
jgi:hypothetical protein